MSSSIDVRRTIFSIAAAALLVANGHALAAQTSGSSAKPASNAVIRRAAIALLQTQDTTVRIDERRIAVTVRALRAIESSQPSLTSRWINGFRQSLLLEIADSVAPTIVGRSGARVMRDKQVYALGDAALTRTGIRSIDSLNRRFDARNITLHLNYNLAFVELDIDGPFNFAGLRHLYGPGRNPQIMFAMSNSLDWPINAFIDKGRSLDFVFAHGNGDCWDGCSSWDYSYVSYDTLTNVVTDEKEWNNKAPPVDSLNYWDYPNTFSFALYPTVDRLIAGTRDERWWYRTNAIRMLEALVDRPTVPRNDVRAHDYDPSLQREAAARREDLLKALVDRLTDPDPQVKSAALDALRASTRKTFAADRAGIAAWTTLVRDISRQPARLEIYVLNVGQGDATVLREGKHVALIDAGLPSDSIVDRLRGLGIDSIDVFIASHNHGDHIGSAPAVLSSIPVGLFVDNGVPVTSESETRLQRVLAERGTPQSHAPRRTITLGTTRLDIIPPPPGVDTLQNNHSLVVRISRGNFHALFTGDSELSEIKALLAHEPLSHVDLLKAPHHGDTAAAPANWLRRLMPTVVAVSRARGATGNEESDAILKYYNAPNRVVGLTERGDIAVIVQNDGTYAVYNGGSKIR